MASAAASTAPSAPARPEHLQRDGQAVVAEHRWAARRPAGRRGWRRRASPPSPARAARSGRRRSCSGYADPCAKASTPSVGVSSTDAPERSKRSTYARWIGSLAICALTYCSRVTRPPCAMNSRGRLAEQRVVVLELRGLRVPRLGRGDRGPRRAPTSPGRACPRRPPRPPSSSRADHGAERARTSSSSGAKPSPRRPRPARAWIGAGVSSRHVEAVAVARMPAGERPQHQPRVGHASARAGRRRPASSSPPRTARAAPARTSA